MTTKQVITISPSGTISGLQVKPGKGLDLRRFGHAKIERVSEIVWCEEAQAWFVQVLSRPVRDWMLETWVDERPEGEVLWSHWIEAKGAADVLANIFDLKGGTPKGCKISMGRMLFQEYEDAVSAEVDFLNALRLKGIF